MFEIYVGSSKNNIANMGGWGVVIIKEDGNIEKYQGCELGATQNAMILKAAIEGLSKTPQDCEAKICSKSEYLVLGINDSRQRKANRELWEQIDELINRRHVEGQRESSGRWLDEAQIRAKEAVGGL